MKYLLIALLFPVIGMGQQYAIGGRSVDAVGTTIDRICKHIYVAVEETQLQPIEKLTKADSFAHYSDKLIVCIKCHHLKRQKIGYGIIEGGFFRADSVFALPDDTTGLGNSNSGSKFIGFWHPARGKLVANYEITIGSGSCGLGYFISLDSKPKDFSVIDVESCEAILLKKK